MKNSIILKDLKRLKGQLRKWGFLNYQELLKSDAWKWFRLFVYSVKKRECCVCHAGTDLAIHHKNYKKIFDIDALVILCKDCHSEVHALYSTGGAKSIGHALNIISTKHGGHLY